MSELTYIDLKECILSDNDDLADKVRIRAKEHGYVLWNIMSSPGAGKTTFILDVIRRLGDKYRFAVVEADIESTVDAEKFHALGIPTVQLRTGGFCHLDASMTTQALDTLPLDDIDVIIVENVGNLVCPAEFDLGADMATMLLSVPEGDDKAIKYPLMFTVCQALMVTKIDALPLFNFDFDALERNSRKLNDSLKIYPVSAKTGEGMEECCKYLSESIENIRNSRK